MFYSEWKYSLYCILINPLYDEKGNKMATNTTTLSTGTNTHGYVTITIVGRLDSSSTSSIWQKAVNALEEASPNNVVIDAKQKEQDKLLSIIRKL